MPRNPKRPPESRSRRVVTKVQKRPAETAGASGSVAGLITALILGNRLAAATAAAGVLPAIWTFWKANCGWEGIKNIVRYGRPTGRQNDDGVAESGDLVQSPEAA